VKDGAGRERPDRPVGVGAMPGSGEKLGVCGWRQGSDENTGIE